MNNSLSLSELTNRIQETIKLNFDTPVWIRAEISELRENPNGHCYLELIEKDTNSDNLLAKSKATIWSSTYRMLKPYFEGSTGQVLRSGLNVLIAVTVEFHGVYGFNLNVRDIDPTFTIGEMAARRLKIMRQLEEDGIAEMNRELNLPLTPQRLAVISSPTAAGYDDFMNQLNSHQENFKFYPKLFPAIMQGEQAESSIISALEKIYNHIDLFDVVVIIRGGGATTDLACFDSYELALNCAQFPLPIIAGIGHQRDVSILDMIAHSSVKTPTAAAEFLIEMLQQTETKTQNIWYEIYNYTSGRINTDKQHIQNLKWKIKQSLQGRVTKKHIELSKSGNRLKSAVKTLITLQQNHLLLLDKSIEAHSPAFLIKHGYTITTVNGKRLMSMKEVRKGEKIRTHLSDGSFESEVL
jgi:exodeoxyribonuclease VII large subunit